MAVTSFSPTWSCANGGLLWRPVRYLTFSASLPTTQAKGIAMKKTDARLFPWVAIGLLLGCGSSTNPVGGSTPGTATGTSPVGFGGASGAGGQPSGAVPGVTTDNPGGTWTVVPDAPTAKGPKANGAGTDAGTVVACSAGADGAIVTSCGYPYASSNPLTSVEFNESEVLRAVRPSIGVSGGVVSLLYADEHAMTLGVRQVAVTSGASTTATDYPVSPLTGSPDRIFNPQTGTNALTGDQSGLDPSLRPLWPVLYVTDVTKDPTNRAGDWQMGGRPINPNAVFGTWKSAVRTVDKTTSPPTVSVTPDADPAKNNWNLGVDDPVPTGIKNEGWGAEVRWGVVFQPGHSYRLQVIVHDGDQNKVGGDCGEACVVFCAGTGTPPPAGCPTGSQVCGEGMAEDGKFLQCPAGESCTNGCCSALTCPTGSAPCGQIGTEGEIVGCRSGESCVSGCCITPQTIY